MTAKEFVECWKREKEVFLANDYLIGKLSSSGFELEQLNQFKTTIDSVLTDVFYTLLLGLDGAANIGGVQQRYTILDENCKSISKADGELEAEAWKQFHS